MVRRNGDVFAVAEGERRWPDAVAALSARLAAAFGVWAGFAGGPVIMGILNATPDSFSDGGRYAGVEVAIAAGERMLEEGADILDVGGESTRPGAAPVSLAEEQARALPVIRALARAGATVSIDTRNAATMARGLDAGAAIINDVSAFRHDPAAVGVAAEARCPVMLMHMRGTPETMMAMAHYKDVAADVTRELGERVAAAEAGGVRRENIAVDPGFGFAKTHGQNIALMRRLPAVAGLGLPVAAGMSRKATIGTLTGEAEAGRRVVGSAAAAVFAVRQGARVLRVHDVRETRQALAVWAGLNEDR